MRRSNGIKHRVDRLRGICAGDVGAFGDGRNQIIFIQRGSPCSHWFSTPIHQPPANETSFNKLRIRQRASRSITDRIPVTVFHYIGVLCGKDIHQSENQIPIQAFISQACLKKRALIQAGKSPVRSHSVKQLRSNGLYTGQCLTTPLATSPSLPTMSGVHSTATGNSVSAKAKTSSTVDTGMISRPSFDDVRNVRQILLIVLRDDTTFDAATQGRQQVFPSGRQSAAPAAQRHFARHRNFAATDPVTAPTRSTVTWQHLRTAHLSASRLPARARAYRVC